MAVACLSVAYGIQEEWNRKGERQKARDTEPVPFYQENNSSPGGPTRGTSSYIHGPELGHVVTPAMRETGKANICINCGAIDWGTDREEILGLCKPKQNRGSTPHLGTRRRSWGPGSRLPWIELQRCRGDVRQVVPFQPTPSHARAQPGRSSSPLLLFLLLAFSRLAFLFLARCLQWLLFV